MPPCGRREGRMEKESKGSRSDDSEFLMSRTRTARAPFTCGYSVGAAMWHVSGTKAPLNAHLHEGVVRVRLVKLFPYVWLAPPAASHVVKD